MRPAKTQISLDIRPVWSESSLSAWRKVGSLATLWTHSEDSDQTGRLPRLIWAFVVRIATLLVLSRGGSFKSLWKLFMTVLGRRTFFPDCAIISKFKVFCCHAKWSKPSSAVRTTVDPVNYWPYHFSFFHNSLQKCRCVSLLMQLSIKSA